VDLLSEFSQLVRFFKEQVRIYRIYYTEDTRA